MRVKVEGMCPGAVARMLVWRFKRHPGQTAHAAVGIAIGVALVFAVQVTNSSITASAKEIVEGVQGKASLQVVSRTPEGFSSRVTGAVDRIEGVRRSAPVMRARTTLEGDAGSRTVELVGITPALAEFGGRLVRNFGYAGFRLTDGIVLPVDVARVTGLSRGAEGRLLVGGRVRPVPIGPVLGGASIGPLAQSPLALTSLSNAQRLTGRRGRITHLLVEPEPGMEGAVAHALRALVGERLLVLRGDSEVALLEHAAQPNDQSTSLFSALGALVGLLLAFGAVLLTTPERRRFIAELRTQGFAPRQIMAILGLETLTLGVVGSVLGLAVGGVLARTSFADSPDYLGLVFPLGPQRVVQWTAVAIALGCGIGAALLASAIPTWDLFRRRPGDLLAQASGEASQGIGGATARRALTAGLMLAIAAGVLAVAVPALTLLGVGLLALAAVLVSPATLQLLLRTVGPATARTRRSMLPLAFLELGAARVRSAAVVCVVAVAVFGSVALGGARGDLISGLDATYRQLVSTADVWVTSAPDRVFATEGLTVSRERARALARTEGVRGVREHHSAFADWGNRRVWVIARSGADSPIVPRAQLARRSKGVDARIARGGWATVSRNLAHAHGLAEGDLVRLPTPSGPLELRVAAVTLNMGWPPGAVILSERDYLRGWRAAPPTALLVDLERGVGAAEAKRRIEAALGNAPGIRVQTRGERASETLSLSKQGLSRLAQIGSLLLIAAALAVAAATGASALQRRRRLAALKVEGFGQAQLLRSILVETGILLTIGSLVGAAAGLYGHALATHWLEAATGFSAPLTPSGAQLLSVAALIALALAASLAPGYAASRVPPRAFAVE